ncbi:MAG: hypothetical protein K8R23_17625 [Chthoniobacter sp.]|nr:hypothetical protein [Chthoniobacter sp.]
MQRLSILSVCVLAVLATACEKHPASERLTDHEPGEHHAAAPGGGHDGKVESHVEAPKPAPAKPEAEAKPGEAPKFFPDSKPESK